MAVILEFPQQYESFHTKGVEWLLGIGPSRARKLILELVVEGRLEAFGKTGIYISIRYLYITAFVELNIIKVKRF